jgi:hypothetical protein
VNSGDSPVRKRNDTEIASEDPRNPEIISMIVL